jgi:hypothetical protein
MIIEVGGSFRFCYPLFVLFYFHINSLFFCGCPYGGIRVVILGECIPQSCSLNVRAQLEVLLSSYIMFTP